MVSTGGRWSGSRGCPLLSWRVPSLLSALPLCLWWVALEYGSISRFKGVFSVVWGVCVGLCCFGALRGLCGFCAREPLGGLKACSVFASVLFFFASVLSFCPLLFFFAYLLGLCLCCSRLVLLPSLFVLVCLLLFLFPFRYMRKKRGRNFLRPLSFCCGLVISL